MRAAKAHLRPIHFSSDFSVVAFQKARKPLPARRNGIQPLLLMRHPIIPKLALQPLPRAPLNSVPINQSRLIVRPQEKNRRVSRACRHRVVSTLPGDDAVQT